MKRFGDHISVNLRDEELGGPQILLRAPTVLTVAMAKDLKEQLGLALLHASPSFVHPGMTRKEAEQEAARRWGVPSDQMVYIFDRVEDGNFADTIVANSISKVGRYWVGTSSFLHGNGRSWEEAFAEVDRKENEAALIP